MSTHGVGLGPMFAVSNVCGAFNSTLDMPVVGTKVTNYGGFFTALSLALRSYDSTNDRVPGQHFIIVPEAMPYVSAGVGRRSSAYGAAQYVVRSHRGRMEAYLKRDYAAPVTGVAVVVYTRAAYVADPEVSREEIAALGNATHVVVAVLGFAGPNPPLSPYRFVSNLAGGNNEALTYTADDIRRMAKDIKAYDDEWCVVAD